MTMDRLRDIESKSVQAHALAMQGRHEEAAIIALDGMAEALELIAQQRELIQDQQQGRN